MNGQLNNITEDKAVKIIISNKIDEIGQSHTLTNTCSIFFEKTLILYNFLIPHKNRNVITLSDMSPRNWLACI